MNEVLQALTQLLNALTGGYADESLSARAYRGRNARRRWAAWVWAIDRLFFWEVQHCYNAYVREVNRRATRPEDR